MDAVLLSRIQFGLAAGFHFIFPPLTLGLTIIVLIIESIYIKTDDQLYKNISAFLMKILALVFTFGVATGIVLEFWFGANWSNYSRMVGDIFGAPLAAEAILSFFLESVFLGVLIFGRNWVSKGFYWLSALLVCFGSHLSGLWKIIANSWVQTPAGYSLVLAKNDRETKSLFTSIGPVWDGNEVWLLTAGGALFAAFPHLTIYNASSREMTLYIMLIIALAGMPLVIGYTAYVYRIFRGKTS